jgi:hypothetical protein
LVLAGALDIRYVSIAMVHRTADNLIFIAMGGCNLLMEVLIIGQDRANWHGAVLKSQVAGP